MAEQEKQREYLIGKPIAAFYFHLKMSITLNAHSIIFFFKPENIFSFPAEHTEIGFVQYKIFAPCERKSSNHQKLKQFSLPDKWKTYENETASRSVVVCLFRSLLYLLTTSIASPIYKSSTPGTITHVLGGD